MKNAMNLAMAIMQAAVPATFFIPNAGYMRGKVDSQGLNRLSQKGLRKRAKWN